MHIESRPITSVRPYPGNPRDNAAAIAAVADSIRRFGFRQPIVVDSEQGLPVGEGGLG